jgi:hypothetical protein
MGFGQMIGRAEEIGGEIHIFSDRGSVLTKVRLDDGLVGWTRDRVTIRRGSFLVNYDERGMVIDIDHVPPRG